MVRPGLLHTTTVTVLLSSRDLKGFKHTHVFKHLLRGSVCRAATLCHTLPHTHTMGKLLVYRCALSITEVKNLPLLDRFDNM